MSDLLKEGYEVQLKLREAQHVFAQAESKLIKAQRAKDEWDSKLWMYATVDAEKPDV